MSMHILVIHVNIFVLDEIQNLLYIQARLQCNFGDGRKRNEDIRITFYKDNFLKMFSVSCIFI
jgi:hypothetical protein